MDYFDRDGKPISRDRYFELVGADWLIRRQAGDYKRVASTVLDKDGEKRVVNTVWLGLNHRFNDDLPPLIFETTVYAATNNGTVLDDYQERYTTETEALAGHGRAVESVLRGLA